MSGQHARISILFIVAALYDGLLGLLFLVRPLAVFEWADITPPNHVGYVQFPAALLVLFAVMFLMIAIRPRASRGLVLYGIGLKLSYCAVAGGHWLTSGIPTLWKPMVIADALFAVLFVWAFIILALTPEARSQTAANAHG